MCIVYDKLQVYNVCMNFNKMDSAGYLVNHLSRLFFMSLRERIAPLGIAPAQFMLLQELWRDDGITQMDLAIRLDVEPATIANTVARMERDGLVERRAHSTDGRARLVHMTEKAKAIESPAINSAMQVNQNMLSCLSEHEQRQLIAIMRKVIQESSSEDD